MGFQEEIASALERARAKAKTNGNNIVYSRDLSRGDRELLIRTHWLEPIIKGWYILVKPDLQPGESSFWYANFWTFISSYLTFRYGTDYCLSAEDSIDLHTGATTIPRQVVVIVSKGGGTPISLPFNTSIYPYKSPKEFQASTTNFRGLQMMELGYALCKVSPTYFQKYPKRAEIALRMIRTPEEILQPIIHFGLRSAAARLIGAYRFLGDDDMAEKLEDGLRLVGVKVQPENPFSHEEPLSLNRLHSPYNARISILWNKMRNKVIELFPPPPGEPKRLQECLSDVEELYKEDAYNSLSIEGFDVDDALIEKVRNHQWEPDTSQQDRDTKNALAARGYYEAFQDVEKTIEKIFGGMNPGEAIEKDLSRWFQSLFSPSVRANIIRATDLLGYRKSPVYIRNSRHIPLPAEALLDAMEAFFSCLKNEKEASVRAVLGHFIFTYIHPYMDGNGRLARFIMNVMLLSGGYPWTIIHLSNRQEYLSALEQASVESEIDAFVTFVAKEMKKQKGKG